MSIGFRAALVAAVLALSGGVAAASPAGVTGNLNLRAGPGTNFAVVGVVPAGATVDVRSCGGGWCRVGYGGYQGYVSSSYLSMGSPVYVAPAPVYRPYRYYYQPYYRSYYRPYYRPHYWRHRHFRRW